VSKELGSACLSSASSRHWSFASVNFIRSRQKNIFKRAVKRKKRNKDNATTTSSTSEKQKNKISLRCVPNKFRALSINESRSQRPLRLLVLLKYYKVDCLQISYVSESSANDHPFLYISHVINSTEASIDCFNFFFFFFFSFFCSYNKIQFLQ
jgi:hypothetical protein